VLFFVPACTHRSSLIKKRVYRSSSEQIQPEECKQIEPILTVWIHGTRFWLDALYKKAFNAQPGLKALHELPAHHKLTKRMKALADQCADFFPYETVYCFCWSGKLKSIEREEAADILHESLFKLINDYQQKHGHKPAIRLVCHSHGANVALNLARVNAQKEHHITIDELILFACPVQCETKNCARNSMFKRIYSFYSPLDMVQITAPQWVCRVCNADGVVVACKKQLLPLSDRRFDKAPNIRQAWIKRNGWALNHTDFSLHCFLRLLPELLEAMNDAYNEHEELTTCKKQLLIRIEKS
jgi:hypothetical protein